MVSDKTKGDSSNEETKKEKEERKKKKQEEVSCWNCFVTELKDKDPEPLTLSEIRKENKKSMKLYSFFASELSKPRAISLKQKVSENYVIGKKLEEKIQKKDKTAAMSDSYPKSEPEISLSSDEHKESSNSLTTSEKHKIECESAPLKSNILMEENHNKADVQQTSHQSEVKTGAMENICTAKSNDQIENLIEVKIFPIVPNSPVYGNNEGEHLSAAKISTSIPSLKKVTRNITSTSNKTGLKATISSKLKPLEAKSAHSSDKKESIGTPKSSRLLQEQETEKKSFITKSSNKIQLQKTNLPKEKITKSSHSPNISETNIIKTDLHISSIDTNDGDTEIKENKKRVENISDKQAKTIELFQSKTKFVSLKQIMDCNEKSNEEVKDSCLSPELQLKSETNTFSGSTDSQLKANVHTASSDISNHNDANTENIATLQHTDSSLPDMHFRNTEDNELDYEIPSNPTDLHISESDDSEIDSNTKLSEPGHPAKIMSELKFEKNIIDSNNSDTKSSEINKTNIINTLTEEYTLPGANIEEKIVQKVEIKTSTPKTNREEVIEKYPEQTTNTVKTGENLDEIEKIIKGMENISLVNKETVTAKYDNVSTNESESGYAGSSLHDFNEIDGNLKTNKEPQTPTDVNSLQSEQNLTLTPKFKTSLPSLKSSPKSGILSMSTKSLSFSPSKIPVRKVRWSTLSLARKSKNDEVYMSDSLSPGHATLPRRSNSPLPHERDLLDRDRFPLNRSGLQARSESMASVYSGAGEGTRGSVTVRGEVQVSLLYNYRLGALEVGVKRCRDLAPVDVKRNRSDPYVKVYLLPDKSKAGKRKTKVKKNTLSPVFEETLSFAQPLASLSARTLWLSVWHADMFGRNDFLGEVTLPLADVVFDDPAPTWYKLHERTEQFDEHLGTRGDLIVGLKFETNESDPMRGKGTLHVLIKEAKNLVATKPNGLADVFCKSYLLPERGRLGKQKTGVARRTLSPRWEHAFAYRGLRLPDLAARALELSLWDRDRLASNDFMGAVRLSLGSGQYMGASVNWMDSVGKEVDLWQTMMNRPNLWVERSLPLRPQLNN